jgi:hypothetical protein
LKTTRASGGEDSAGAHETALVRATAELSSSRDRLALSIQELRRELVRVVDWRQWIRRRPVLAVSLAFGLGFLLGRRDDN